MADGLLFNSFFLAQPGFDIQNRNVLGFSLQNIRIPFAKTSLTIATLISVGFHQNNARRFFTANRIENPSSYSRQPDANACQEYLETEPESILHLRNVVEGDEADATTVRNTEQLEARQRLQNRCKRY